MAVNSNLSDFWDRTQDEDFSTGAKEGTEQKSPSQIMETLPDNSTPVTERNNYSKPDIGMLDVNDAPGGTRIYLYEKAGVASHDQKKLKVAESAYPGKNEEETSSTLGSVGKGASIGATAGTAVPIPGVGTAVGTAIGSVIGLGTSLFGGGQDQTQMDRVLPSLLQPLFAKAGAQTKYSAGTNAGGSGNPDASFGTKGLHLSGKEFRPENVMETVEKVIDELARKNGVGFNDKGNAARYKRGLSMSATPPGDTGQSDKSPDVILSFPKFTERQEQTAQAQTNPSTGPTRSANAKPMLYASAIIGAAAIYLIS